MLRLVGGVEMWNGLVPHPRMAVKNQEGYLSWEGPSEEEAVIIEMSKVK